MAKRILSEMPSLDIYGPVPFLGKPGCFITVTDVSLSPAASLLLAVWATDVAQTNLLWTGMLHPNLIARVERHPQFRNLTIEDVIYELGQLVQAGFLDEVTIADAGDAYLPTQGFANYLQEAQIDIVED